MDIAAGINLNTTTFNLAQCLKETHNWGSTIYNNICSGITATVEWGTVDYVITTAGIAGLSAFGLFLITMTGMMLAISRY